MQNSIEMQLSDFTNTVIGITEKVADSAEYLASIEGVIFRLYINRSHRMAVLHEGTTVCKYLRGRSKKVDSIAEALNIAYNLSLRFKKCSYCQP